jgi:hypothetical protein
VQPGAGFVVPTGKVGVGEVGEGKISDRHPGDVIERMFDPSNGDPSPDCRPLIVGA